MALKKGTGRAWRRGSTVGPVKRNALLGGMRVPQMAPRAPTTPIYGGFGRPMGMALAGGVRRPNAYVATPIGNMMRKGPFKRF